jgi:dihydrofolate synthase/folylpolyglutamate synthase
MALKPASAAGRSRAADLIEQLMQKYPPGFDLGLGRISSLLQQFDNPHRRMPPVIHVAGTNGKGSTIAFMRSILEASGRKVHVHTSPHLVRWHERFRVAGKLVEDDALFDAISRIDEALQSGGADVQGITVFEIMTAAAFLLFAEVPADVALIEVGLGGEFDATNVIEKPATSVIAPIDMDHQSYLGDTLTEIAKAKAGIIKRGSPVVFGAQQDEALDVLNRVARRAGSATVTQGQDFHGYEENGRFVFQNEGGLVDLPLPNLIGRHQISNATLAIAALQQAGFTLTDTQMVRGVTSADWPGRMQKLPAGRLSDLAPVQSEIWLDGGHNPHAGQAVAEVLANLSEKMARPLFLICAMLNTKDQTGYFRSFDGLAKHVFTVPVATSDAGVEPETLASKARSAGLSASAAESVEQALEILNSEFEQSLPPRILICGSLYLAGDVLALNGTPPT